MFLLLYPYRSLFCCFVKLQHNKLKWCEFGLLLKYVKTPSNLIDNGVIFTVIQ